MLIAAKDLTMDFIMEERARELADEQTRWLDLKRWGKLVERVNSIILRQQSISKISTTYVRFHRHKLIEVPKMRKEHLYFHKTQGIKRLSVHYLTYFYLKTKAAVFAAFVAIVSESSKNIFAKVYCQRQAVAGQ
ncbi:MAG: RagB/SusD family nutrient uptake outer membrane protein [Spirosomataceae bacterium]